MKIANENPLSQIVAVSKQRRSLISNPGSPNTDNRLDFRAASNHLRQKEPGFYLVLLRKEIRRRNLRGKSVMLD